MLPESVAISGAEFWTSSVADSFLFDEHPAKIRLKTRNNTSKYENLKFNLQSPPDGYSIHSSTISDLKGINPLIGADLDIVRKLRVISDYDFNTSILNDLNIEYTSKKQNLKREFKTKNEILNFLDSVYNRIQSLQNKNKPHNGFNTMSLALAGLKKKL